VGVSSQPTSLAWSMDFQPREISWWRRTVSTSRSPQQETVSRPWITILHVSWFLQSRRSEVGSTVIKMFETLSRMLAFGAGTRVCIGELFALHRLLLFTANCVRHFHFLPPDGTDPVSCDPKTFKTGLVLEIPSYKIRIVPRSGKWTPCEGFKYRHGPRRM